ncbi:TetR/AcrR family transcriptional regulator [Isoptericola cucumis]|uniref:HTH tetR-type domain-containing protein n=1 Tax=Isoptericola cucumis TaxID=1776856 RepID=A0ABQ2B514_9MICO|nr:TetR/AcrR family transcriptional regulator [Isoptericola cucumis]GGI06124.1 hypothetical protein GCM10007368_09590 [Isoptericola cucumis]
MPDRQDAVPRTKEYATGRVTRRAIIAEAAEAFAEKGFHGASLRGIAREAGVDHATLMHHFGNKTALLLAVIEWHDAQDAATSLPAMDFTVEGVVDAFVGVAERNRATPGLVQLLSTLSAEAGREGHPARAALQQRHQVLVDVFAAIIRLRRDEGAVDDDGLSPEVHAALIVSTWEGLQVYDALHPGDVDVPELLARTLRRELGLDGPLSG